MCPHLPVSAMSCCSINFHYTDRSWRFVRGAAESLCPPSELQCQLKPLLTLAALQHIKYMSGYHVSHFGKLFSSLVVSDPLLRELMFHDIHPTILGGIMLAKYFREIILAVVLSPART